MVARTISYLYRACCYATLLLLLSGCAAVGRIAQLEDGWYHVPHLGGNDSLAQQLQQAPNGLVYVEQHADTLLLSPYSKQPTPITYRYKLLPNHHTLLLGRHFDLDVFTLPVKARLPRAGVPVQLNTTFNAALYVGRRLDFYYLHNHLRTPWQQTPRIRATGLGYGLFFGMGSTIITSDVTRQRPGPEYEGFVLHAGAATIYDARIFNIGLAMGFDNLLGPDRTYWIYQRRPWLGLLFGLDLN
ncbi:hypothetical protein MUN82_16295 [Hymenobacter aerilatus]|uniref:Outer membrane protein beta-barrel domain-containing protein n=1 Tax=Hymenobacter aerilatus TaxID=2932251 RepID=A0A8T9SU35_9BACT|nr:hypothetical protein [Hymenobacter aerilatus]UOR04494.1 hypothetical protein MUN82_16295 [Hymenobacter aerilatus]